VRATVSSVCCVLLALVTACGRDGADGPSSPPTWHQDVAPLVAGHCQSCHSAGGIAPFALTTYAEAGPMAPRMIEEVTARRMPPFGAVPRGDCAPPRAFLDDPTLTTTEIDTLRAWVDAGAPEGDAAHAAALPEPPSRTLQGVTQVIAPPSAWTTSGTSDQFICMVYDPELTTDMWLTGIEFRPSSPSVVHHAVAIVDPTRASAQLAGPGGVYECFGDGGIPSAYPLGGYTPGALPFEEVAGSGIRVPASSLIVVQFHYHPLASADPISDETSLALRMTSTFPGREAAWVGVGNEFDPGILQPDPDDRGSGVEFRIPAGVAEHTEQLRIPLGADEGARVPVWSLYPHMHYLGTRMLVELEHADGSRTCLIDAGRYDFDWQRPYVYDGSIGDLPLVRFGDKMVITCTYDNTLANEHVQRALAEQHLSAPVDVYYGEQTLDEMCIVLVGAVVP